MRRLSGRRLAAATLCLALVASCRSWSSSGWKRSASTPTSLARRSTKRPSRSSPARSSSMASCSRSPSSGSRTRMSISWSPASADTAPSRSSPGRRSPRSSPTATPTSSRSSRICSGRISGRSSRPRPSPACKRAHGYNQVQLAKVIGKGAHRDQRASPARHPPRGDQGGKVGRQTSRRRFSSRSCASRIPRRSDALWEKVKKGGTVRAARATKKTGEIKDAQTFTTTTKALAAAKGLLRRLQELAPGELTANHDQYQELVRVKAEIDELMATKAGGAEA